MGEPTYHAILFYNGDSATPSSLSNFTDEDTMKQTNSTFHVRPSMYDWTQEADGDRGDLRGLRARFHVVPIKADRQALQILHDVFLDKISEVSSDANTIVMSLALVPITEEFLVASTKNGGDPMAVDSSQAPYIQAEVAMLWSSSDDDQEIDKFLDDFNAEVTNQLQELDNVLASYIYLNYADETQAVFKGYPKENVERLRKIRQQFDPELAFTNLMPGGWKIPEDDGAEKSKM